MKIRLLFCAFLSLFAALSFSGCATAPAAQAPRAATALLVGPLLDRIVPADFVGDGEFGERGQYLHLEVHVRGLRRTANGWTWTSLRYRRTVTIPLVLGAGYRQEGWITLGPPAAASGSQL